MKRKIGRLLALFLALAMVFALVSCGGSTTEEAQEENLAAEEMEEEVDEPVFYQVGDKITTGMVEFQLLQFEFTDSVCSDLGRCYCQPLPETADYEASRVYSPDYGNILVYMYYTLQNVGKMDIFEIERPVVGSDGESVKSYGGSHNMIDLDWNDGYIFQGYDIGYSGYCKGVYKRGDKSAYGVCAIYSPWTVIWENSAKLATLSDPVRVDCIFEVPIEVAEEDTPLELIVYLPDADENGVAQTAEPYTYIIR